MAKSKAQKAYDSQSKKLQPLVNKAKKLIEAPLGLGPAKQVLTGLDGQQLRATTPPAVQEAADEYFERKADVEQAKDRMATALDKIESEMKASDITVCVVRQRVGDSMTCRIRSSSKLEIKKVK
jgi:hypothetical protein